MRSLSTSVSVRRLGQVAADVCLVAAAYYLAYVLRFDSGIPHKYGLLLERTIIFVVLMKVTIFALFGLYSKLWRFVDQKDFESTVKAVVVATVVVIAALFLLFPSRTDPPRGVIALDFLITLALVAGSRFLVRAATERPTRFLERASREVLIVGAGNGGQQVAFELRRNPQLSSAPIGFVDDDPRKRGMRIAGLKVLGSTDELPRVLDDTEPDEVIIAIPSAPGILRQLVVTACRDRGIPVRTLPTTFELLSGGVNLMRQVREVRVEDVLGREPVRVEIDQVGSYLGGRVVLGTGAGGAIGAGAGARGDRPGGLLPRRGGRAGARRGRVDGSRAVPADRAGGAEAAGAGGQRRKQLVRDPPRAGGGPPLHPGVACPGRLQGRH